MSDSRPQEPILYQGGPLDGHEGVAWDNAEEMTDSSGATYRRTELVTIAPSGTEGRVYEYVEQK